MSYRENILQFTSDTAWPLPVGGKTNALNTSGYVNGHLMLLGSADLKVRVDGILSREAGSLRPGEADWARKSILSGPGFHAVEPLPSLVRLVVLAGTLNAARMDASPDLNTSLGGEIASRAQLAAGEALQLAQIAGQGFAGSYGERNSAGLTAALAAGAGKLAAAEYRTTETIKIPNGTTLQGVTPYSTVIRPDLEAPKKYAVEMTITPAANEYGGFQTPIRDLAIDGTGAASAANMVGLRMGGAYRTVENVRVKEFGVGILYDQSHTYLNTLKNFMVYSCIYGVVFEAGVIDSGENILGDKGAVFNNRHNLYIKATLWDITYQNISLDYPTDNQILVEGPVQLQFIDGHVENGPGAALVGAVNPNTDAGTIRFTGTAFAGSASSTSPANALIGPNVRSVTLVFDNCSDVAVAQRFSRVIWRRHDLPTVLPTPDAPWKNNTGVSVRARIIADLTPTAGQAAVMEGYVGPDAIGLSLKDVEYSAPGTPIYKRVLNVVIPNQHYFGVGHLGITVLEMQFEGIVE